MKTFYRSAFALGLLFTAASCSSDSKSSDKTTVATTADSGDSTATTTAASTGSNGGSLQDQVADQALEASAEAGITFDEACLRTAVAALTDADAQAILDAGVTGDPDVSPAGDAVATAIGACAQTPESTATSGS